MSAPRFAAVIEGIGGEERYLDRKGGETVVARRIWHFRTETAAATAARAHIDAYPRVVQRAMRFRVVPL